MPESAIAAADQAHLNVRAAHRKRLIALLAVIVVGLLSWFGWRLAHPPVDSHRVFLSGRLEGYETNLSPKIGGRIESIAVREGARVSAGQLLAQLNDADYQAQLVGAVARIAKAEQMAKQSADQLQLVKAQISGAQKRLSQSKEETSAQISQANAAELEAQARLEQARADVEQAKTEHDLASIRLQRYTDLVKKGAVTKDDYDQAKTTFQNTSAAVRSRQANMEAQRRAVNAAKAGQLQAQASRFTPPIRTSDVNVVEVQLNQAQHQLNAAQQDIANARAERDQILANINYLQIRTPITGIVTARPVEPGAVLAPGQTILTVLDFSQVYLRGFVPEGRIGAIRVGQRASVVLDSDPSRLLAGKVIEIDPEASFTPENIYFKDDRVKQVFGIKIGIDDPQGFAKPGMPADGTIEL